MVHEELEDPAVVSIPAVLNHPNVVVGEPLKLTRKIEKLIQDGAEALHIISDFDMTLTKYWLNGRRNYCSHSVLTNCPGVSKKFIEHDKAIVAKYYPYEISTTISHEKKVIKMIEWWNSAHLGYIEEGFTRSFIRNAVKDFEMEYREGALDLIHQTGKFKIPLLVFSAGIADIIEELLDTRGLLQPHVHVVSNNMVYSKEPPHQCIAFRDPLIHSLNKGEVLLHGTPFYKAVSNRRNAILLGDSLGDTEMGASLDHDTVLTVGFLNFNVQEQLPLYAKKFDIVILGDSSFSPVLALLDQIFSR